MIVNYAETLPTSVGQGEYNQVFKESAADFAKRDYQVVGAGFGEIVSNEATWNTYLTETCRLMNAEQEAQFRVLAESTRMEILRESTSGITPFASLTLPILRRFWPRLAINEVVPVVPVSKPKLQIGVMVPYLIDLDGNRHKLPHALVGKDSEVAYKGRTKLTSEAIAFPCSAKDLLTPVGASKRARDAVDVDFYITKVQADVSVAGDGSDLQDIEVAIQLQTRNNVLNEVVRYKKDGVVKDVDVLFANVDRTNGTITGTSVGGKIKKIYIDGYVTSEYNNRAEEVTFEMEARDVVIDSGDPIVASLTHQMVQDVGAMYNLDAHMMLSDLAASVLAQKHDTQGIAYIEDIHRKNAFSQEFKQYSNKFDMHPPVQFAGQPKDWREELKRVIDFQIATMKNDFYIQRGETRVIGNAVDTNVIHNMNWILNGQTGDQNAGITVDYGVSTYSTGSGNVRVVSTPNKQKGNLKTVYIPSDDTQVSLRYLPYSFNVFDSKSGYRNPNAANVPSVMLNRRDSWFTELPMVGEIVLENNDGSLVGNQVFNTKAA